MTIMNKNTLSTGMTVLALGAGLGLTARAQSGPAPQITVNGQVLKTESGAFTRNGRVLVPMRDIFQSLGATVNFNSLTHEIAAQNGTTTVRLSLGSSQASVNNVPVTLQSPAQAFGGRTYVPLRFVSEALGATVNYNAPMQMVAINSQNFSGNGTTLAGGNGMTGTSRSQVAGLSQISVPTNAVVPVTIDNAISSADATVGQRISATVVSKTEGDSEFPAGTKLQGEVVAVSQKSGDNPGTLDLRFTRAITPDGQRVPLDGTLASLDNDAVQTVDGRLIAKGNTSSKNDTLKIVGIGAGAGFLLGKVLKQNSTLSAVLGAAGGYLYDKSQNKKSAKEARLAAGDEFGVRLRSNVTYRDTTGYAAIREAHGVRL